MLNAKNLKALLMMLHCSQVGREILMLNSGVHLALQDIRVRSSIYVDI